MRLLLCFVHDIGALIELQECGLHVARHVGVCLGGRFGRGLEPVLRLFEFILDFELQRLEGIAWHVRSWRLRDDRPANARSECSGGRRLR